MITILGCKESSKQESKNFEKKVQWFFWSVDWHPNKEKIVVGGSNDTFFKLISSKDYKELKSYRYKADVDARKKSSNAYHFTRAHNLNICFIIFRRF